MPIVNGQYVAPTWVDNSLPAIDATELNALCGTVQNHVSNTNNPHSVTEEQLGLGTLLWSGSWSGGTLTVPQSSKYTVFSFVISADAGIRSMPIGARGAGADINTINASGSVLTASGQTTFVITATTSGDVWTISTASGISHLTETTGLCGL